MADKAEYKNDDGQVTIVVDGQTVGISLDDPLDASSFKISSDGINVDIPAGGGRIQLHSGGDIAALSIAEGLKLVGTNLDTVEITPRGEIKISDHHGRLRFRYIHGKLSLADSDGNTTFEVDAETGDIKLKGSILRI